MLIRSAFSVAASLRVLVVIALAASLALPAQRGEDHKLLPGDRLAGDSFGAAVATDGQLVAVGAPGADQSAADSGSAYLFAAATGAELRELVPVGGAAGDRFGAAIAVAGDVVIVGAPGDDAAGADSGAAHVFDAATGARLFELVPVDAAAGDHFGHAVAMDGDRAVIGSLGAAYLFDVPTGQQLAKLLPMGGSSVGGLSGFGEAVDIDVGLVVVGARLENGVSGIAGAVYVYDAASGTQLHRLVAQDGTAWANFGASVAVRGTLIAIGAPEANLTYWHAGTAYLFDAVTGRQMRRIVPTDGHLQAGFGGSIAIDGPHVVIGSEQNHANGAFGCGSAYVYAAEGGRFVTKLLASDAADGDELGGAVAAARGVLVAGAARDDDGGGDSGSAYVFDAAGSVLPMAECFRNAGALLHIAGIPVAGQTLGLRVDVAQSGALLALLALSGGPVPGWPSCGLDLGRPGHLLVDAPFATLAEPWVGSPVDFAIPLPSQPGLVGARIYLQGAFVAPAPAADSLRLTGGLEVSLGGYL